MGIRTTHPPDFTRPLGALGNVTALGIGTALGEPTDAEDERYERAIVAALDCGVGVIDTAINYRCQRSERAIGRALAHASAHASERARPVVCTKGGYVPLESPPPASKDEYREYLGRTYLDTGIIPPDELVAGGHCIAPGFLRDQVARSRANLCVDTIDLYYLHNPEQQLEGGVDPDVFARRLRAAFETMEQCVSDGAIRAYGCATWSGLRVSPDAPNHLSLELLSRTAHDVAGDAHHFTAVQLPASLAMPEAMRLPTQRLRGTPCSALQAADALGVGVVVGAALMHGDLAHDLPAAARAMFPDAPSDAACALTFTRMLPGVSSVVVGMRSAEHVRENVGVFATALA